MRTITAKLTRIYFVVVISTLVCAGVVTQLYLYLHARAVAHQHLSTLAVALAGNLESSVSFGDARFAQQTLDALQHYPDVSAAAVVLPDGRYFSHYPAVPANAVYAANAPAAPSPPNRPNVAKAPGDRFQALAQGDFMSAAQHGVVQTIALPGEAPARLLIVASLASLNREIAWIASASSLIGAIILLAAYTIFRRMSRAVTRPIEELTAVMREVERDGDQGQRVQFPSDDEIGELAKGFNSMLSSLDRQNAALSRELDERKRMQDRLDYLAHYDPVTRLPNRHYFQERLKLAVADTRELDMVMAVLFVDLDNFKLVNDSYGHHVGDLQLLAVAERLSGSLRAGDVVCRLGGDEFAIILDRLPNARLVDGITEKLIQNLTQPLRLESHDVVVTGSIGIALCPEDAGDPESLVRFADTAMYAAKGAGKNTWRRFDPEMANRSTLRLTLESQMRLGLHDAQFEVHYQAQIDLRAGCIRGLEALARWNHPDRGYIHPGQFIPVAEESGLIRPLGEWVLRTACRQIVEWNRTEPVPLRVAVNVSVRQLMHGGFADQVLATLAETGCPPGQLELEITESVLMQPGDRTLAVLEHLHAHGIGIVIDDFGTGYSSMAQLKNIPVSKIKIDKSFVNDITTDRSDQAITATIVSLAHNLDIQVVAEGVETADQVLKLRQAGCHDFQGYYFTRPLPAAHALEFMRRFRQTPGYARAD